MLQIKENDLVEFCVNDVSGQFIYCGFDGYEHKFVYYTLAHANDEPLLMTDDDLNELLNNSRIKIISSGVNDG